MSEGLGLKEDVSMALGGMIGGGIYAVLGVVAGITMAATWAEFLLVVGEGRPLVAFFAAGVLVTVAYDLLLLVEELAVGSAA